MPWSAETEVIAVADRRKLDTSRLQKASAIRQFEARSGHFD